MVFPAKTVSASFPAGQGRSSRLPRWITAVLSALMVTAPLSSPSGAACITATDLFQIQRGGDASLLQPSDVAIKGDQAFVLDDLNGRVARFTLSGKYLSSTKLPGGGATSYLGLDVGGDDNLYLASPGSGKVLVLSQSGSRVKEFPTAVGDESSEPVGIRVARGQCFVVDNEAHAVKVFDLEGGLIARWGNLGEGALGFRYPFRVALDSIGRVIVTDTLNSRIKVFTPKGEPLFDFGDFGVTEGTLYRPAGLAVHDRDRIFVADNYHGAIQSFTIEGSYEGTLCGADEKPLVFQNPVSLAVKDGLLLVLEMGAGRVRGLRVR